MDRKRIDKRIMTMNVSVNGFRDTTTNPSRIQLAMQILYFAKTNQIDCICFPAGFLISRNITQIRSLLVPMTRVARKLQISFVLGIDGSGIMQLPIDANSPEFLRVVEKQKMPCFLFSFNAMTNKSSLIRQRSCTGEHARRKIVPDNIMTTPRTMDLGGASFQIIFCGEVYDRRLFAEAMPKAGVIFGHRTMPRLSKTMSACSRRGFSLVNSEHRSGLNGLLFCYDRGINKSKPCNGNIVVHDELWAEIAIWKLNAKGRFSRAHSHRI